jgi:hypothetical protein
MDRGCPRWQGDHEDEKNRSEDRLLESGEGHESRRSASDRLMGRDSMAGGYFARRRRTGTLMLCWTFVAVCPRKRSARKR